MTQFDHWLLLVASLPTKPAAARMRLWRALKAAGAATLRDGAFLLPAGTAHETTMMRLADEVGANGGEAEWLRLDARDAAQQARFVALFDRGADYAALLASLHRRRKLDAKALGALRRDYEALAAIDFFPGPARAQAEAALIEKETALAGDEPSSAAGRVRRLDAAAYQGRLWATRRGLWVDRMASAWLIRRFIDPAARFRWLAKPEDCPKKALGFDFDGATFTHVGERVTFEALLASFGLEHDAALARIGTIVHVLDVGGAPVAEAAGIATVLAGLKARAPDDDALVAAAAAVFDGIYESFSQGEAP